MKTLLTTLVLATLSTVSFAQQCNGNFLCQIANEAIYRARSQANARPPVQPQQLPQVVVATPVQPPKYSNLGGPLTPAEIEQLSMINNDIVGMPKYSCEVLNAKSAEIRTIRSVVGARYFPNLDHPVAKTYEEFHAAYAARLLICNTPKTTEQIQEEKFAADKLVAEKAAVEAKAAKEKAVADAKEAKEQAIAAKELKIKEDADAKKRAIEAVLDQKRLDTLRAEQEALALATTQSCRGFTARLGKDFDKLPEVTGGALDYPEGLVRTHGTITSLDNRSAIVNASFSTGRAPVFTAVELPKKMLNLSTRNIVVGSTIFVVGKVTGASKVKNAFGQVFTVPEITAECTSNSSSLKNY